MTAPPYLYENPPFTKGASGTAILAPPGGKYSGIKWTDMVGPGNPHHNSQGSYTLAANSQTFVDLNAAGIKHERGLKFTNGKDIILAGGKIEITDEWVNPDQWVPGSNGATSTTPPYGNDPSGFDGDRNGLQFSSQTGTVYVIGCHVTGINVIDCCKWGLGLPGGRMVFIWCRFETKYSNGKGSGPGPSFKLKGGFHCDGIQSYGGQKELVFFWSTIISGYQGGMIKDDSSQPWTDNYTPNSTAGQTKGWGKATWHSCNFRYPRADLGETTDESLNTGKLLNLTQPKFGGGSLVGPMELTNCYMDETGGTAFVWTYGNVAGDYGSERGTDTDSGRDYLAFPNFPAQFSKYGDRRGQKFFTTGSRILRGIPKVTTLFPWNPVNTDFALASEVGLNFDYDSFVGGVTPPPPDPPPPPVDGGGGDLSPAILSGSAQYYGG